MSVWMLFIVTYLASVATSFIGVNHVGESIHHVQPLVSQRVSLDRMEPGAPHMHDVDPTERARRASVGRAARVRALPPWRACMERGRPPPAPDPGARGDATDRRARFHARHDPPARGAGRSRREPAACTIHDGHQVRISALTLFAAC
jgi:hypothetical protein